MKKGSRILYASFDRVPAPKGASVHITQFVRELALHNNVTLITPGLPEDENHIPEASRVIVDVEGKNFLADTERFAEAVADEIARGGYDVVHVRSIWEGVPAAMMKEAHGHKLVYEVNGLPSVELRYHFPSLSKNKTLLEKFREMELLAMLKADRVITQSNVTKNYLIRRGMVADKAVVIPNGVDTELFSPPKREPDEPVKIIYAGTLAPWQGIEHLLEAHKRALKSCEARLFIIGKWRKDRIKELKKKTRKLKIDGTVEFMDPVRHREMSAVIGSAHIGVAPFPATERNTRQGFCPIKLLEYMACGRAVIASDVEAVKELVTDGKEGLLYKANSTARLADAIVKLAKDKVLRRKLGLAGRRKSASFTWKKSRASLGELYSDL